MSRNKESVHSQTKGMMYREYIGSATLDIEARVIHGKIIGIEDLVTYESGSVDGVVDEFKKSVDDYIETCKSIGKKPQVTKPTPPKGRGNREMYV